MQRLNLLLICLIVTGCAAPNPSAVKVTNFGTQGAGQANMLATRRGDTVERLAQNSGLNIQQLLEMNGLVGSHILQPGQRLTAPLPDNIRVIEGDTIDSIARAYGLDRRELARANNMTLPVRLSRGQILQLPKPAVTASSVPSTITSTDLAPVAIDSMATPQAPGIPSGPMTTTTSGNKTIHSGTGGTIVEEDLAAPPVATNTAPVPSVGSPTIITPPQSASTPAPTESLQTASVAPSQPVQTLGTGVPTFNWPVNGNVLSGYGPKEGGRVNEGVNIGAPLGTPVRVAAPGEVVYVGDNVRGFGNLILVRHSGGYASAYAHIQNPLVKRGDRLATGQAIAQVGKTGTVDSPQLHFEIRKGTASVDPMTYLR